MRTRSASPRPTNPYAGLQSASKSFVVRRPALSTTKPGRLRVAIRARPILQFEKNDPRGGPVSCISFHQPTSTLTIHKQHLEERHFQFDRVCPSSSSQNEAFEAVASETVKSVLNGYHGTILAYGQTGSGKTHSIFGSRAAIDSFGHQALHSEAGIVPRVVDALFTHIASHAKTRQFKVSLSFLQIYLQNISDLLRASSSSTPGPGDSLAIRADPRDGIFVEGLTSVTVRNRAELLALVRHGAKMRATSSTIVNPKSSRSHAVLQVLVEQRWVEFPEHASSSVDLADSAGPASNRTSSPDPLQAGRGRKKRDPHKKKRHHRKALLTIVDLAGSERLSKSGSEGVRLEEAIMINKSISALGNCVQALAEKKPASHVPFRDSKLTRLLTQRLSGNSDIAVLACISSSPLYYEESLSTLLFASRAMNLRTAPTLNERIDARMDENEEGNGMDSSPLLAQNRELALQQKDLRSEIARLKQELQNVQHGQLSRGPAYSASNDKESWPYQRSPTPGGPAYSRKSTEQHPQPFQHQDLSQLSFPSLSDVSDPVAKVASSLQRGDTSEVRDPTLPRLASPEALPSEEMEQERQLLYHFISVIHHLQNEVAVRDLRIRSLEEEVHRLRQYPR